MSVPPEPVTTTPKPTVREAWEAAQVHGWSIDTFKDSLREEYNLNPDTLDWDTAKIPEPDARPLLQSVPLATPATQRSGGVVPVLRQPEVDEGEPWSTLKFEPPGGGLGAKAPKTAEEATRRDLETRAGALEKERQEKALRGIGIGPVAAAVRERMPKTPSTPRWDHRDDPYPDSPDDRPLAHLVARPKETEPEEPLVATTTVSPHATIGPIRRPIDRREAARRTERHNIKQKVSAGLPGGPSGESSKEFGREIAAAPVRLAGGFYGLGAGAGNVLADWMEESLRGTETLEMARQAMMGVLGEYYSPRSVRKLFRGTGPAPGGYEEATPGDQHRVERGERLREEFERGSEEYAREHGLPGGTTQLNKLRFSARETVRKMVEQDRSFGHALASDTMHMVESLAGLLQGVTGWHGSDTGADTVEGFLPQLKAQFSEATKVTEDMFPGMAVLLGQLGDELGEGKLDTAFNKPVETALVVLPTLKILENALYGIPVAGPAVRPYVDPLLHPVRAGIEAASPGLRKVGQAMQESPLMRARGEGLGGVLSRNGMLEALRGDRGGQLRRFLADTIEAATTIIDKAAELTARGVDTALEVGGRAIKELGRDPQATNPATGMTDKQAWLEVTQEQYAPTMKLLEEGVAAKPYSGAGGDVLRRAEVDARRAERKLEKRQERAQEMGDVLDPDVPAAEAQVAVVKHDLTQLRQAERHGKRLVATAESQLVKAQDALDAKRAEAVSRGETPTSAEIIELQTIVDTSKANIKLAKSQLRTVQARLRGRQTAEEEARETMVEPVEGSVPVVSEAADRARDLHQVLLERQRIYDEAVRDGTLDTSAATAARNDMHAKRGAAMREALRSHDPALIEAVRQMYNSEVRRRADLLDDAHGEGSRAISVAEWVVEQRSAGRPVAGIAGELSGKGATSAQVTAKGREIKRFLEDLGRVDRLMKRQAELSARPHAPKGAKSPEDLAVAEAASEAALQEVAAASERVRALQESLVAHRADLKAGLSEQRMAQRLEKRLAELEDRVRVATERRHKVAENEPATEALGRTIESLEADLVVARENLATMRKSDRTQTTLERLELELEEARLDHEAATAAYEHPDPVSLTLDKAERLARAQVMDEFIGDVLADRPAIYRPTDAEKAAVPTDRVAAERYLSQRGYTRINRKVAAWLGRRELAGAWIRKGFNRYIRWRERAESMMRDSTFWGKMNRFFKANVTTRNLKSALNNVLGMAYHHAIQQGDMIGWGARMLESHRLARRFRDSPESLTAADRAMMEYIRDTGLVDTTLLHSEIAEIGGTRDKPWPINRALESTYNWGDQTGKLTRAIYVYRKLTDYTDMMEVGSTMTVPVSRNRTATMKKVGPDDFELNGKRVQDPADMLGRAKSRVGAQSANDILFDYKNIGIFEDMLKGSPIVGVASPFVTWFMQALDLPFKKGLMARMFDDIPFVRTDSAAINRAIAMDRVHRMLNVGKYVGATLEGGGAGDDLERLIYSYSPKDVQPSVRNWMENPFFGDGGQMFVIPLGSVDVLSPTRRLINLAWHYNRLPLLDHDSDGDGVTDMMESLLQDLTHEGEFDPRLEWMLDANGKPLPKWKDVYRRVRAERRLIMKTKAGQRGTYSDHLALLGLGGSFIMEMANTLEAGDKPWQKETSLASLANQGGPLLLGGTAWSLIKAVAGSTEEAMAPESFLYDFSRRGWTDRNLPDGEEDLIKFWIRGLTGKYYRPAWADKHGAKYFKDVTRVLKSSLTGPMKKNAEVRILRRDAAERIAANTKLSQSERDAHARKAEEEDAAIEKLRQQVINIEKVIMEEMRDQRALHTRRRERRNVRSEQRKRPTGAGDRGTRSEDTRGQGPGGVRGSAADGQTRVPVPARSTERGPRSTERGPRSTERGPRSR